MDCPMMIMIIGSITTMDNCSATRGSVTRDETMMATQTASSVSSGPTTKMANSHIGCNIALNTNGVARK